MTEPNATVTKPLYATVGAGDALYTAVNDLVEKVRERAATADVTGRVEEARERLSNLPADVQEQFESLRQRLTGLPSELPDDVAELRERLTPEELRRLVDQYYHQLVDYYQDLAARGEETVGRLRSENTTFDEQFGRVEGILDDVVTRAEDVFGKVTDQTRGLLGQKVADEADEAEPVVDAEVVKVTTEPTPATNGPAKKAPAKKAPAKAAPAKAAKKTTAPKK
ncbi:heparin-binding hemagglutinin [Nocardia mexicana]|uniref:Heparin binding hemagglutinin HbhA n=1 Tax=Nocardia mexicana TaxID=279262 RepID=A0A370H6S5_9NOCA|nr:heparin-binding hemagglutinin [Nocardia mexicana]RDI52063.1 heparin binding hemagglutinin HbhA [Nocardia mexicana]